MATGYSAGRMVAHNMVTTQFDLDGFRVIRTSGVCAVSWCARVPSSEQLAPVCRRWWVETSPVDDLCEKTRRRHSI